MAPVPQFLNIQGLVTDMQHITDTNRGKWFSNLMMGLALLKNYNPYGAPHSLTLGGILKKFDKIVRPLGQGLRQGRPRPHRSRTSRNVVRTRGTSSLSPACGSRTFSTTISAAPRCASSRTARRKARSRSVPTTPASAGVTSSSTCTRTRPSPSGTKITAVTRSSPAARSRDGRRVAQPHPQRGRPCASEQTRNGRPQDRCRGNADDA